MMMSHDWPQDVWHHGDGGFIAKETFLSRGHAVWEARMCAVDEAYGNIKTKILVCSPFAL